MLPPIINGNPSTKSQPNINFKGKWKRVGEEGYIYEVRKEELHIPNENTIERKYSFEAQFSGKPLDFTKMPKKKINI